MSWPACSSTPILAISRSGRRQPQLRLAVCRHPRRPGCRFPGGDRTSTPMPPLPSPLAGRDRRQHPPCQGPPGPDALASAGPSCGRGAAGRSLSACATGWSGVLAVLRDADNVCVCCVGIRSWSERLGPRGGAALCCYRSSWLIGQRNPSARLMFALARRMRWFSLVSVLC